MLAPNVLASTLETDWLSSPGTQHPSSAAESADRFAAAVSNWFSGATAAAFPCVTAMPRRPQLAAAATGALQSQDASLAGSQLALALMTYMAGQVFGAGVASPPVAVGAAQSAITSVFSNLDVPVASRANTVATGIHTMAISTIVVFPPVISPPAPVT